MKSRRRQHIESVISGVVTAIAITVIIAALGIAGYVIGGII